MNKKGQAIFLSLMLAITFFFIGLALAPAINVTADSARSQLTCSAPADTSINILCTILDLMKPYVIGIIFALAGGLVGSSIGK